MKQATHRHLRVRRAGLGKVVIHKSDFCRWLAEQPRKKLTWWKNFPKLSPPARIADGDLGWTAEDFTLESMARGIHASYQTTCKRMAGVCPRPESLGGLVNVFPGIKF